MNRETKVRAIAGLVLAILTAIKVFTKVDICIGDEFIFMIVDTLYAGYLGWKNNDFSEVSSRMTEIMRTVKRLAKNGDMSLLEDIEKAIDNWGDENAE